jgi:hypothetical protein
MTKALGVAKQRLGVRKQVVADGHRLSVLEVGVAGHHPTGVIGGLRRQSLHGRGHGVDLLAGGGAAVEAEVERDLVVARAPGVQRRACWRDLGQPSLDRGVDVLVRVGQLELAVLQLTRDAAKATFDGRQLRTSDDSGGGKPARVRDAAGDVVRVELEVDLQR